MKKITLLFSAILFLLSCDNDTFVTEVIEVRDLQAQIINVNVPLNSWSEVEPGTYNTFVDVFEIDEFIMEYGVVFVYQRALNSNAYRQLPVTDVIFEDIGGGNLVPYSQRFEFYYSFGQVELLFYDDHPNPILPQNFEQFRIVVIDGTTDGLQLDNKSFDELMKTLEEVDADIKNIELDYSKGA